MQPPGQAEAPPREAAGRGGGLVGAREEEPRRHREAEAAGRGQPQAHAGDRRRPGEEQDGAQPGRTRKGRQGTIFGLS